MIKLVFNKAKLTDTPIVRGEFDFEEENILCHKTLMQKKKISFQFDIEFFQDLSVIVGHDAMKELIGQKLKEDFINKFL